MLGLARDVVAASDIPVSDLSFATTTFSVETGLPSNVAQALIQTRDGYLWVGTEGGVARFDGVRFRIFRVNEVPALGDNLIRCFFEDRDGALWIGTQKGVARYADGRFERIGDLQAPVAAIVQHPDGAIWIGTQDAGLWEYRASKLEQRADGRLMKPTDSPMRLFVDSTGRIWAAINHGALLCIDRGAMHVPEPAMAGLRQANRFLEYPRGTLWIGNDHGLFRWRNGELRQFGKSSGLPDDQVTDLSVDHAGRLWVAVQSLWVAENPEADDFTRVTVPQVEYPRYFIQDREGTYWIGSSGDGLARMRPSAFRMLQAADDTPLRRARTVTVDTTGAIWAGLGAEPHGLVRISPDRKFTFVAIGHGAEADVNSLCGTSDGAVWIGCRGSLAVWRDGVVKRFRAYQNVRVIFEASDHSVWFGGMNKGAVRFHDGAFSTVAVPPEYAQANVTAIAQDRSGAMYLGYMGQGMLRIDGDRISRIDANAGLPALEVRAIHFDAQGRLWVGFRRDGLAVFADGKWYHGNELVQPFGERVTAIDEDDSGNLWLGTVRGVMWGRKDDFMAVAHGASAEGRFRVAGGAEGVGSGVVGMGMQPAMCKTRDGTLWFAAREGLVAVRPGTVATNAVPPPVYIETVTIDGRSTTATPELRLAAEVRSLSIDYTALSFVQPNRVMFKYRLDGHDTDWVQAGTRRTAFYTRIEPGRHRFRVIASNEDGVWSETGASLLVIQAPWFYQTWWFYALVAIALTSMALALYAWRTAGLRRLVAHQTEQIRQQLEKEAQLRAELERNARLESLGVLAGGIAHDFNNLLTVIIANIGLATTDQRVRAIAGNWLAAAERGARRAADLTQQLLTFARGGDPVRRAVALPDVVREAAEFARHGTQVRCDIEIEPNLPPANVDRAQISRVVHNLVLNATQAMPEGGIVRIRLASAEVAPKQAAALLPGRYVKLSIADHGGGIAPEHLARIFEPYFSTKPKNHGLGLATVHSIVKKHQGDITVESQVGQGTTFHVWLPAAVDVADAAPAVVAVPAPRATALRVLFMDDEEVIRTVVEGILRHLGHDGLVVADGADAIREYEAARKAGRPFDVVVLDLTVPGGMGGRAAMEVLRRIDPDVRAIVSSGYSSDPVLAHYRAYGFQAVVPKPYQVEELGRAIQEVARGQSKPGAAAGGSIGDANPPT